MTTESTEPTEESTALLPPIDDRKIFYVNPEVIQPGAEGRFVANNNELPVYLDDIRIVSGLSDFLDIQYSQIGNVLISAFRKRPWIWAPGINISIVVRNFGKIAISAGIELECRKLSVPEPVTE